MSSLWRIALRVPAKASEVVSDALEPYVSAVTALEDTPGGEWTVEGIAEREPERSTITAAMALAAATVGSPPPDTVIEPLPDVDWLALNRQSFPPIRERRVWIHGSHIESDPPAGTLDLKVDAARAFGSGSHATTALCLLALQDLARRRRPQRALDLGCGSGILAMALAKLVPSTRVLAVDLDPISAATARDNVRLNRLSGRVQVGVSNGWRSPLIRQSSPFDLVVANILAGPLAEMAPRLRRGLVPGGRAILSGLLTEQERWVLSAHRAQGFRLVRRYRRNGWSALVLR